MHSKEMRFAPRERDRVRDLRWAISAGNIIETDCRRIARLALGVVLSVKISIALP